LYKLITQKSGYFIAGKFDQLQRDIPYQALVAAFQELVRQLLTETEAPITTVAREDSTCIRNQRTNYY
jgi:predicted ATPase